MNRRLGEREAMQRAKRSVSPGHRRRGSVFEGSGPVSLIPWFQDHPSTFFAQEMDKAQFSAKMTLSIISGDPVFLRVRVKR